MRRTCWPRPGRRRVHLDGRSGRADEMIAAGPPKQCRRISGDGTGGPHEHSWVRVPMCIAWAPDVGTGCLRGAAEFGELVDRDRECLSGHEARAAVWGVRKQPCGDMHLSLRAALVFPNSTTHVIRIASRVTESR